MKNMMKLALVAAMAVLVTINPVNAGTYYRPAKIIRIRREVVTTLDTSGNIWKFRGTGFRRGENLILVMNNNKTRKKIKDDLVTNVIRWER